MKHALVILLTGLFLASSAQAQTQTQTKTGGIVSYTVDQTMDDVLFALENEIIGRGLKIDTVNHVGEMLDRTGADLGTTTKIYTDAQIFNFCSAVLSREMMEANPLNIAFCPYRIFVFSTPSEPDKTTVGFNGFPDTEMKKVGALLDGIVKDALELK
jgi:uncharacterized protein (DUF302 family)